MDDSDDIDDSGIEFLVGDEDFWNSFIPLRVGLLWFWCISCNWIVWSGFGIDF